MEVTDHATSALRQVQKPSHWIKSLVDYKTDPDSAEKKILPYREPKRGLSLTVVRHAQLCQSSRLPYSLLSSIAVAKVSSIKKFEISYILLGEITNCTRHTSFTTSYKCIGTILIFLTRTNNLYAKFQTQLGHFVSLVSVPWLLRSDNLW
jgi:hypothetical protein